MVTVLCLRPPPASGLLSVGEHVVLSAEALLKLARSLVAVQVRDERNFKTTENHVRAAGICSLVVSIQKHVEQIVPEVDLPIPVRH